MMSKGEVVLGLCVPHTPRIIAPESAAPVFQGMVAGLRHAAETLRAAAPDVIVLVSAHWVTTFNVYIDAAERHGGILTAMECPDLLQSIAYDLPGDGELARAIAAQAQRESVPAIAFEEPNYVEDYGTIVPLRYLTPDEDIPVVPISSCLTSSLDECRRLGTAVRAAVEQLGRRAAIVASSAFAHNVVRGPETWPAPGEREIDDRLIEMLTNHRLGAAREALPDCARRAHYEQGGRPLATLLGALEDSYRGKLYGYGPSSGSGNPVIAFQPSGAAYA